MNGRLFVLFVFLVLSVSVTGCGNYSSSSYPPGMPPGTQGASVTLTLRDAPPAGVTVLSFELTVNGATLNPGGYNLISSPKKIEIKQLETDAVFLSTASIPPGIYQSITVNFTNPELTILNQSGAAIGNCANNAVCEISPAAAGNVTFSGAPFPINLQSGSAMGFQVDVNLAALVSNDLSLDFNAAGAITVNQLPLPGEPADHLDELDDLVGTVMSVSASSSTFILHTASADFQIQANSSTEFEFESCAANNSSCLQNNMVVEVDAKVMSGGTFIARKIEFEDEAADNELEGAVFKIDDASHFEMVVLGELSDMANVSIGNPIVVTLSNPSFEVDTDGLNVPSSQGAFESATDASQLLTGQVVEIRLSAPPTAGTPITVTANRVRLRMTQLTATVSGAPAPPNFTLGSLPGLFTNAGVTSIQVQTSSATDFDGVSGVSGLADQNVVSVRGLLFKNGANPPVLIAGKVRKR
jgi:Domain of unknown function (DUF5666)/Domain of unknown function (DUF4382)